MKNKETKNNVGKLFDVKGVWQITIILVLWINLFFISVNLGHQYGLLSHIEDAVYTISNKSLDLNGDGRSGQ